MAEVGEKIAEQFLIELGLSPMKIKEGNIKTPDFKIFKEEELVGYCEEKTLDYDDFEGEKNDPFRNKISNHIHQAVKQFKSVNPEHQIPNILVFNNMDSMMNVHDLFITITGKGFTDKDKLITLFPSVGRIKNDLEHIDLYIWFDKGKFSNIIWSELHEKHDQALKLIFKNIRG